MYGIADAKGVELEVGDPVRILVDIWEDDDPKRKGTTAKVDSFLGENAVLVCFDADSYYEYYCSEDLEIVT